VDGFEALTIETGTSRVHVRRGGRGRPVLLLHGFPETLHMWRDIAPLLAADFAVVCAGLPGYGGSGCPPSAADHEPYSKRAMAREMVAVMAEQRLQADPARLHWGRARCRSPRPGAGAG
jgi:haloacetate dehalogenase